MTRANNFLPKKQQFENNIEQLLLIWLESVYGQIGNWCKNKLYPCPSSISQMKYFLQILY